MTVPNQAESTPEAVLRSLGAERRLTALELRAERDGHTQHGDLQVTHYRGLAARFSSGRFSGPYHLYHKRLANGMIDLITRDEALRLLREAK